MPTKKQQQAMTLYAELMEEVKIRLSALEYALDGRIALHSPLVREFCFLQLRMLCELIALGCLVAHGDIAEANKLRKEYSADKIIARLDELHSEFYPLPVDQKKTSWGFELVPSKDTFLTKEELPTLYGRCGNVLHRGNLKKLLSPRTPIQKHFPDVIDWGQKISNLLRCQLLPLIDGKTQFLCVLRDSKNKGLTQVSIAEAYDGPIPGGEQPPSDQMQTETPRDPES